jgi:hypothetical protein
MGVSTDIGVDTGTPSLAAASREMDIKPSRQVQALAQAWDTWGLTISKITREH